MKPISFEENRKIQVGILLKFVKFCEDNNLQYFLAYGTLLGAVRHKGYIPWDDDIDVWMPRPDYDKFIRIFRKENTDDRYCIAIPGEKISKHSFVKMYDSTTIKIENGVKYKGEYLGVDIDVWPIDGQPDDFEVYSKWYKKLKMYYFMFFAKISSLGYGTLKRRIKVLTLKLISGSKKQILAKTEKIHKAYTYESANFVGTTISFRNPICDRHKKESFREYILLDFEGHKLRAPIGYDKILTQRYGDYMQLPPEEQRVTHHSNNVFWKE